MTSPTHPTPPPTFFIHLERITQHGWFGTNCENILYNMENCSLPKYWLALAILNVYWVSVLLGDGVMVRQSMRY